MFLGTFSELIHDEITLFLFFQFTSYPERLLIESPEVNAWCMPGGKIAVYTWIMPVLKSEAALAAVLGHEVAHATQRHGQQRYMRAIKGQFAGFAVAFFDRKFSLGDETQADKLGQTYMAKAGYDPEEADKLWQRMSQATREKSPPEFLSTHPLDQTRRKNLRQWLPRAREIYSHSLYHYGYTII